MHSFDAKTSASHSETRMPSGDSRGQAMPAVSSSLRNVPPGSREKTAPAEHDSAAPPATLSSASAAPCAPMLRFEPTRDPDTTRRNLHRLLTAGVIRDQSLGRHIERLHHRYRTYSAHYPYGQWTPDLIVTDAMRSATECYLPAQEIRSAFRRLFSLSLRYRPLSHPSGAGSPMNWLDFLASHRSVRRGANPAQLLDALCRDEALRMRFLFEHFLPRRHGGGFSRYPRQMQFLKRHLEQTPGFAENGIRCLDAACGTGEGTYDLAGALKRWGIPVAEQVIHGSTIDPLELFAAAHGFFPHEPAREANFKCIMQSLTDNGALDGVEFLLEDISIPRSNDETVYDAILCNGLLGGPALHREEDLAQAVASLAGRLRPGGILLAADRFHGGWKKLVPASRLMETMSHCGLTVVFTEEGVAATKGE